ncbi:AMP-binding protein [Flavisphingomonas formosensis]|uniref:AMP-binding protein n=1 Tax=Flavisphingomonas formosensis TaxID=861534 RepID=UPI0012FA16DF|nr:AMP-binding protein [Sphingomonas formosensis]
MIVTGNLLRHRAETTPERLFALFESDEWSFGRALEEASAAAAGLATLGLGKGDVLLLWMAGGPDFLRLWLGANLLGAIVAPVNLAYKGSLLRHVIALTSPRVIAVDSERVALLADVATDARILLAGEIADEDSPISALRLDSVLSQGHALPELPALDPLDTQCILFTSGTTGASKGVIVPYAQLHAIAATHFGDRFGPGDRYLLNLPMFHVGGLLPVIGALITGCAVVASPGFRTTRFWQDVRAHGVTGCTVVGAAAEFLKRQPESPDDAANPLRWVSMFPLVRDPAAFARRFGVGLFTGYGMTELSIPITTDRLEASPGSCGQLRAGYEALLVDEADVPVGPGEVGELVLRAEAPGSISPGYWRDAEATAEAWRNGWFHTGDCFRRTDAGFYHFVDRRKDALRRRGENISSQEVEAEIMAHRNVAEAAVIGVPSPYGEQDVMAVVVLAPGRDLTAAALDAFLEPRLPRFMLPRYIRFTDALPRTPSLRVQKYLLRETGVTAETWDREAAGTLTSSGAAPRPS